LAGGPLVFDLSNPISPTIVGGYSGDGYTHDAQVVIYHGPDVGYDGREVAFNANVDTVTIVDFTDKSNPQQISRTGYPESAYAHQGWLSEDHRYFFLDDELDEVGLAGQNHSRTHLWDMADLDQPEYLGFYEGVATGIDHNLYVKRNYIYQANNASGLRVLKFTDEQEALSLSEVAFLDTHPETDDEGFEGAWSVYPFFDSGSIIVSDRSRGLFVVRLDIAGPDFNGDGQLGCDDIDAFVAEIAAGTNDPAFDLTVDGLVDLADRDQWLAEAGAVNLASGNPYLLGDANLDGVVDGADFIIWNEHKFTTEAAWCAGDFTADGQIDGLDFIVWNQNRFQSADGVLVPEPALTVYFLLAGAGFYLASRAKQNSVD